MKKFLLLLFIIPVGLVGWVFLGIQESADNSENILNTTKESNDQSKWVSKDPKVIIIGNPDAKVSIIEYADFKCPECGKYHHDAGKKIRTAYVDTGLVNIVFRPYPVYADDGVRLLRGSYCAQEQGKFTAYHDAFFEYMWANHFKDGDYQKAIDLVLVGVVLDKILADNGINQTELNECIDSKKYESAYMEDLFRSGPDEIQGTPSFIISGQKVVGPQPFSIFKALIDIELKKLNNT